MEQYFFLFYYHTKTTTTTTFLSPYSSAAITPITTASIFFFLFSFLKRIFFRFYFFLLPLKKILFPKNISSQSLSMGIEKKFYCARILLAWALVCFFCHFFLVIDYDYLNYEVSLGIGLSGRGKKTYLHSRQGNWCEIRASVARVF